MLFYIVYLLLLILLFGNYKIGGLSKPKSLTYIGIGIFVSVLIFRFDVGWDYPNYYQLFIPSCNVDEVAHFEPIDRIFCYITDYFHFPPLFFMIFGLLTSYFFFDTALKYSQNYLLAVISYVAIFYDTFFGIIREGLAIAIIFYAYRYLVSEKWLKYAIACIIAGMIHYSAFIGLIFPFLYKLINSPWKLVLAIIITSVFSLGVLGYAVEQLNMYETYINGDKTDIGGGRLLRYAHAIIMIALYILTYMRPGNEVNRRLLNIGLLGLVFSFLLGGHVGGRVALLFMIYSCIAIPNILSKYTIHMRFLWISGLSMWFLMVIYVSSGITGKSPYTPYKTIFTANITSPIFK